MWRESIATAIECRQKSPQRSDPEAPSEAESAMREMLWLPSRTIAALSEVIDLGVPKKTELAAFSTLEEMPGSFSSTCTRSAAEQAGSRSTPKVWRMRRGFL